MKILITGSSGMLGRALCQEFSDKYEIVGLDIVEFKVQGSKLKGFIECDITDITDREKTIANIVSAKPNIVIHTAAYTDVDGCEENPEKAHRINALGTETVALACRKCGAFLYYISTDFVFYGEKESAYVEKDLPNSVNIYGKSKLDGEKFVQSILKKIVIVRSSWLFGKGGRNFVDTLLNKAKSEKRIEVVNDQFGSPTYTRDLTQAINRLIGSTEHLSSIYHITNSGSCSWYEFAKEILKVKGVKGVVLEPATSEEVNRPARRPKMSILENQRYQELTGEKLRPWQDALGEYLQEA